MSTLSALVPIATIWLAAHLSPGPDFIVATRTAIFQPRLVAMQTVAGICVGTVIWAVAGYYGINILFAVVPWFYGALKLCGGIYLIYLGVRLLLGSVAARETDDGSPLRMSAGSAFRLGLLTNLANPKAALFTASLFAATMSPDPTASFGPAAVSVMVAISFCFYGLVVGTLTTRPVATAFGRAGKWLDRIAGAIFVGLGARFALDR